MTRIPDHVSEKQIETMLLNYLKARGIFCFKVDNVGFFDTKRKIFRTPNSPHRIKGLPDIHGIFKGVPFYIEVKKSNGQIRPEQKAFLERAKSEGAIAFIARNIDDIKQNLGI